MRRAPLAALLALGASTLGACMIGPNFTSPDAPRTDRYLAEDQPNQLVSAGIPGGEAQQIVQSLDIPGQWWGVFQSRPLNNLIESALVANPDIQAASASLRVAQFNARAQRATLFPTIQAGFNASQNQSPWAL
jgi:outer membrane protein TolC